MRVEEIHIRAMVMKRDARQMLKLCMIDLNEYVRPGEAPPSTLQEDASGSVSVDGEQRTEVQGNDERKDMDFVSLFR